MNVTRNQVIYINHSIMVVLKNERTTRDFEMKELVQNCNVMFD